MRLNFFLTLFFLVVLPFSGFSQVITTATDTSSGRKLIQFSGVVVDADSLQPLPYVAIVIRNTTRGVYCNPNGYYSMVAQEKDTIDFYTFGYKPSSFVIPDTLTTNQYTHVQGMKLDTILLRQVVIYPWPSKEKFKEAFLSLNVPNDDMERARKNLAEAKTIEKLQYIAADGMSAYNAKLQQQVQKNYYAGQLPPNNLLNPVAWARFLQAIRNGDFKSQ